MAIDVLNKMPWSPRGGEPLEPLLTREWLVTNGLGGYASGSVAGVLTRRYHGLLVAALPSPHGRTSMLAQLTERVRLPNGNVVLLGGEERQEGELEVHTARALCEFRLEGGLPVWTYDVGGAVIEKRVFLEYRQNTAYITYRQLSGDGPLRLKIQPAIHFRGHDASVDASHAEPYVVKAVGDRFEVQSASELPPLRLRIGGRRTSFTIEPHWSARLRYRVEADRGYAFGGALWVPGHFRADLAPDHEVAMVASTEPWESLEALSAAEALAAEQDRRRRLLWAAHPKARTGIAAELVLAADQFIITPATRVEDAVRSRASGDEIRTVIAGYHWFTDWGRDTMISLEGLTLLTGRSQEAGYILRTFAHYVRDGLIPNMFPEGEKLGLYHTADATLWFFHAIDRYVRATADLGTLHRLLPTLRDIVDHHVRGTRFGIGVDANDGLLRQGAQGYQLTWMDAKVGDWVVTPRRGKAVEINALWYNALRLLEHWERLEGEGEAAASTYRSLADRVFGAFNERFWIPSSGHLFDVIDGEEGNDTACRPNQVFAISLPHPVLDRSRWESVLKVVCERLVTPVGLRSLAPGHPDYKARYDGDLRARDAAYHQGTVWGWLVGPMVDAWLKVYPEDKGGARRLLEGFGPHLGEACIGSVSEVFDAEAPYTPRGCVAQAWSVAEVLRASILVG